MTWHRANRLEGTADPSIVTVLDRFLVSQEDRLSPRTYRLYESIVQLLQHYLNSYGPAHLDGSDDDLFTRLNRDQHGDDALEFCDIFGPDEILVHVSMFISYFMVRKVAPGRELLRASGTVTKALAFWLADRGYVDRDLAIEYGKTSIATVRMAQERRRPLAFD